jgi:hypothetical protein
MDDTVELTGEEKKARIAALVDLQNTPGWKILCEELSADIALTEAKLFGEAPLAEGETVEGLRRERIDRLELRDLPKNLIEEYGEDDAENPAQDIYD